MPDPVRYVVVAVFDLPSDGVAAFQRYEDEILPLLSRHAGALERRLRTSDGTTEVHVLSFTSEQAYRSYLGDPERVEHRSLLAGVDVVQRVVEFLTDVR